MISGWLWVIVGGCSWVIVHDFLGDCGWLWVIVVIVCDVHHFL